MLCPEDKLWATPGEKNPAVENSALEFSRTSPLKVFDVPDVVGNWTLRKLIRKKCQWAKSESGGEQYVDPLTSLHRSGMDAGVCRPTMASLRRVL